MKARLLPGVTVEDYHDDRLGLDGPTLNSSTIKVFLDKTPLHAKEQHPRLTDKPARKMTAALEIGTALHAMVLEGRDVVVPIDHADFKTKAAREERDAARRHGLIPLKRDEHEQVIRMYEAVRDQIGRKEASPPLLVSGKPEQILVWEDRGVLCRALLDWFHDDGSAIDDVKTEGRTANPVDWQRTMFDSERRYHVQAQFYRRGVKALTGSYPDFRFIVVEKQPPYAVSVIAPSPRALELADEQIDFVLDSWARCLSTGDWPAYTDRVAYIDPPAWAEAQWLDTQFIEEAA